ncbi:hypothetical protein ABIB81_009269 [Bradyrhizobium sp. I1.7.5]
MTSRRSDAYSSIIWRASAEREASGSGTPLLGVGWSGWFMSSPWLDENQKGY